jgi:uncharacterized coiled-coil protein SlyX
MEDLEDLFGSVGKYLIYFAVALVLYFVWKIVREIRGNPVRVANKNAISVKFVQETSKNINHDGKPENQKKMVQYLNGIVIDSTFWFLLLFTFGIGVIIRHISNLMTNNDFDRLLNVKKEKIASQIAARALESHGMDADEVREIPPILAEDFYPKSRFSKLFRDLTFRASEYQMTYLMFSEKQVYSFKHTFDLTSTDTDEQTNEFFYEDITSIDIAKKQRDMPVSRSWQYIVLCLASICFIPLISVLPFVAKSTLLLKLVIFVIIGAIMYAFWRQINRVIENVVWKHIIKWGLIIIIASITLHLFAKSGNVMNEMYSARSNAMNAKDKIYYELNNATAEHNQTTQQMQDRIERESYLTSEVESVAEYNDLPAYLIQRVENYKREIEKLKIQIANYRTQIANLQTQINNYNMQIDNYNMQIEDYNNRILSNNKYVYFLERFNLLSFIIVAITGLILLFTGGFYRRVVEKLILKLTVAGDEFECAMNPDNIRAIQGMKAKIREKKKV